MKIPLLAICFLSGTLTLIADNQPQLRAPLDGELSLSANFGELRPNHFHSGLDFKTGGETGRRVMAAADGYISAIEVSPWGYGRAVYVTHPTLGIVTVYGHLKAFAPEIDTEVRQAQYNQETFDIEMSFAPGRFPVKAGDIIGLSGNAGSSGGPHLHFNVEDLATSDPMDPLPWFGNLIKDTRPPYCTALYLYPDAPRGLVNDQYEPVTMSPDGVPVFTAWGQVIPAIKCNDAMDNSSNIYGVKTLVLMVDGKAVFGRTIDRFPYSATRAINTLVDYDRLMHGGGWAEWSLIPSQRPLSALMGATLANGRININSERDYKCRYIMQDHYGNLKTVDFIIRGRRPKSRPDYRATGTLMRPGSLNTIHLPGAMARIGRQALWDKTEVSLTSRKADTDHSNLHIISDIYTLATNNRPFAGDVTLTLSLPEQYRNNRYAHIVRITSSGAHAPVDSSLSADGTTISAPINQPGQYCISIDANPPTISNIDTDEDTGRLAWRITDTGSGLRSYRVDIDGRYALAELDGKNNLVEFTMDPSRFVRGTNHRAVVTATDAVGNVAIAVKTFTW